MVMLGGKNGYAIYNVTSSVLLAYYAWVSRGVGRKFKVEGPSYKIKVIANSILHIIAY